jgi:hypothetical protein
MATRRREFKGGLDGERAGGDFRRLVWTERLVRRCPTLDRIAAVSAAGRLDKFERSFAGSVDGTISFRLPGDFTTLWGLVRRGALSRKGFLLCTASQHGFHSNFQRNQATPAHLVGVRADG